MHAAPHDVVVYRDGITVNGSQIQYANLRGLDIESEAVMNGQHVDVQAIITVPLGTLRKDGDRMPTDAALPGPDAADVIAEALGRLYDVPVIEKNRRATAALLDLLADAGLSVARTTGAGQ